MHSKSDNREIIINDTADGIIEHFQSPPSRYQIGLGTAIKGSNLIFDYVDLLY